MEKHFVLIKQYIFVNILTLCLVPDEWFFLLDKLIFELLFQMDSWKFWTISILIRHNKLIFMQASYIPGYSSGWTSLCKFLNYSLLFQVRGNASQMEQNSVTRAGQ